jgi:hypothetical protein
MDLRPIITALRTRVRASLRKFYRIGGRTPALDNTSLAFPRKLIPIEQIVARAGRDVARPDEQQCASISTCAKPD